MDVVLEKAMRKCILKLLKSHIEAMLKEFHTADGSWKQLKENLQVVWQRNPQELGVFVPTPDFVDVEKIKVKFVTMEKMYSPEKKVMLLLRVCKLIYAVIENNSATELQPSYLYSWTLCWMLEDAGEHGKSWHQNYLRVAFQELNSGCTGKTLLVRPCITTADVCQLCAEEFKVDNPEEYSLFLFVDDTRQQLTEVLGKAEGSVAGEEWHGHVTALSVAPEFQWLGLAAKLMELLGEISEKKGGFFVDLFVRVSDRVAVNTYKQLGYHVYRTVSERYSASSGKPDEDAYDMRKALSRDTE
ncbi:ras and Rab interactor 2-like [Falco rusticolus]|uniref:ras and Rab interactor 2-like n=1 Tax=Falco rusticolus TaxID=120794 RepID=UPI00188692B7|nr:ras and Rab interactor 2-like [Falco rusticolus]